MTPLTEVLTLRSKILMRNSMKKIIFGGFLFVSLLTSCLWAFEIEQRDFMSPGETEQSPKLFLKADGKLLMLPAHLGYKSTIFNEAKTLAAINFHGLSNYDGVDLVVGAGPDKLLVIPNIWLLLKNDSVKNGIIPPVGFDHTYLEVIKVEKTQLYCKIYGTSAKEQTEVTQTFSVFCDASADGLALRVEKSK